MHDFFIVDYRAVGAHPWLLYSIAGASSLTCFVSLYIVADNHLNRSLELLARRCKMSPAMAGLTLLAFGNGASDFFTAIIGIDEAPTMILGSSVGAGLFISGVVMGFTILFSKPVLLPVDLESDPKVRQRRSACVKVAKGAFLKTTIVYMGCVCALLYLGYSRSVRLWQPIALLSCFIIYIASAVIVHLKSSSRCSPPSDSLCDAPKKTISATLSEEALLDELESEPPLIRMKCVLKRFFLIKGKSMKDAIYSLITVPLSFLFSITIPPLGEQPEEECDDLVADSEELVVARYFGHYRMIVFPAGLSLLLVFLAHLSGFESLKGAGYSVIIGCGLLGTLLSFCMNKKWRQAQVPSLLTVIGAFIISLFWIYIITKELLSALTAVGKTSGINEAILGLTILAWGNSCGDLVSNIALAKNGHAEIAIIAALSGPIQNVLLTLGVSFTLACWKSTDCVIKLDAPDNIFYLTCLSLIALLFALLFLVPIHYKYQMPRVLGFILLFGYCIYLVIGISLIIMKKM